MKELAEIYSMTQPAQIETVVISVRGSKPTISSKLLVGQITTLIVSMVTVTAFRVKRCDKKRLAEVLVREIYGTGTY